MDSAYNETWIRRKSEMGMGFGTRMCPASTNEAIMFGFELRAEFIVCMRNIVWIHRPAGELLRNGRRLRSDEKGKFCLHVNERFELTVALEDHVSIIIELEFRDKYNSIRVEKRYRLTC